MDWTKLKERLNDTTTTIPVVLAGPILRKVTGKSVTVWLALRKAAKVILTVKDERQTLVAEGERDTVAIGKNLHIVAVTAKPKGDDLKERIIYRYDIEFKNLNMKLAEATNNADLGYPINRRSLPSFAIPPTDPNKLRLIQGSCRKPHAQGRDTFPIIDDLIAQSAPDPFGRPHQLLLTGDQIYADDIADTLLMMLTDAADTLLGWQEQLPVSAHVVLPAAGLYPVLRKTILSDRGFTSDDLRCHLMSLGEYLCTYLFVWSPVLWSPSPPSLAEAMARLPKSDLPEVYKLTDIPKIPLGIESDIVALREFHSELPRVRRALANIPSYMIFDDHEVTDDWNMTRNICRNLYAERPVPLGLQIVQNALVAYALCQHWGNAPEQFEISGPLQAGSKLLGLIDTPNPGAQDAFNTKATDYARDAVAIRNLLGVQPDSPGKNYLSHGTDSLQYHFTVEGEGHQVIFTDTRTWRSFPRSGDNPSELLPKDQFKPQIESTPDLRNRVLVVVLSTNAPGVQPIRAAARNADFVRRFEKNADVYESWEIPSPPFDRLLKALTSKLPKISGEHRGAAILLSGDVHHSFATRIIYRATNRFEDSTPTPATAVFAQLVASSFKKQTDNTIGLHREGYYFMPYEFITGGMVRRFETEGFVGWNLTGQPVAVADEVMLATDPEGVRKPLEGTRKTILSNVPLTLELKTPYWSRGWMADMDLAIELDLKVPPHYRYRLDYLFPTGPGTTQVHPPNLPEFPAGTTHQDRLKALKIYNDAMGFKSLYDAVRPVTVVGLNNFSEITFQTEPNASTLKTVRHTLRWWDPDMIGLRLATYAVRLDLNAPNDPQFNDLKARTEP